MSLRDLAYKIAQEEGINPDLFVRQIQAESAFNPEAKSSAGAMGLAQLMPATAKELGVANPFDPEQNLRGGAKYMKQLLGRYNNDQTLALAAYNAGMGNVDKAGGVPNFKETQNYIAKILGGNSMIGAQAPQQMAQQEQPRGLLGGMVDRDFADQIYMAALAGSPNAQRFEPLIQSVQAGRQARREDAKEQKKLELAQKGRNATADYLDRIGQADLANLLRQGGIDAKTALSAGTQASKDTADIREYNLAVSQGYKGTFENWQQAGKKSTEFGTIPSGYQLVEGTDDQGRPTYQMVPVKGSPDYIKEQERLKQQELAQTGKIGTNLSFYSAGERVINSIDNDPTLIPKTGVLAGLVRDTVFGQKQKNVAEDLAIMEAQMQFETLAQLKAQSPSGASGLGQLTDSERRALGKVKYNFDALQGEDAIKRNIRSAMMFRSYFENGLLDPETNTYRNATEEELDMMTQGVNPFTQKGGPRLVGVGRYLGENPNIQVIGTVTIEEVKE